MPVILATQEAEIRRIMVRSQPRPIVGETKTLYKHRAGGVAQGEGPEFKIQYHKNQTNKKPNKNLRSQCFLYPIWKVHFCFAL
jgi:hypothetical protein